MATEITDSNFEETIEKSGKPAMLDFWASWCGPCRMLSPVIDELHSEYSEKGVVIGKVNVDENPELSLKFKIRTIPQLLFFDKNGNLKETSASLRIKSDIAVKIDELIKSKDV